ncbi:MAG TPA: immunoglobulin domain-containing protein [Verrucomicrobiae bacterium]|jgi:plastocyanin|nr:immunoglobulin domain-containing protein [Verrucomicrobiae bacterium]
MKTTQFLLKVTTAIAVSGFLFDAALEAATTMVNIVGTSFVPTVVTVNVGDTIVWKNGDDAHTVSGVGDDQSQFCGSGLISTCSETFNTAGSFPYECTIHAKCCNMTGLVTVLASVSVPPTITAQPLPLDQSVLAGSTVSFSVAAAGSTPLSYQWQLDSTNLSDGGNISGSDTTNLILTDVILSDAGTYSVIVSNAAGTITSSNVILSVEPRNGVAIVSEPAALTTVNAGTEVTLTVEAAGTAPLSYQWMLDGAAIADATNTSYEFDALPNGAVTDFVYTVSVSNNFSAALSSNAEVVVIRAKTSPALTFISPGANARITSALISGKVTDKAAITVVNYWITNVNNGVLTVIPMTQATLGMGGSWSASPTLLGGTNIISAKAVDAVGNQSPVVVRSFFYKVPSPFALSIDEGGGNGTVSGKAFVPGDAPPKVNGPLLNIGEGYSVTAVPNAQSLFTNWSGSVSGTNPTLHFVMEPGFSLQANFVTNFFIAAAGIYNGLFFIPSNVTEQTAGLIGGLTLKTGGLFSGKLSIAGGSWGFSGIFDISGNATANVARPAKQGGAIGLQLNLDSSIPEISGLVSGTSDGGWTANLDAERGATTKGAAQYTMLMAPPASSPANVPPGSGYATISELNANITFVGALADGTVYHQFVTAASNGDVPVYASLYNNTGLLLGWVNLPNLPARPSTTTLTWIKTGVLGFTNDVTVVGSPWTNPPAHAPAITLAGGQLEVSSPSLLLDFNVAVSNNDAVVKISGGPTNSLTGSINAKSGLLKVTFGNGSGKSTTAGAGVILQDQNSGAGFFTTKTNAGALNLQ